MTIDPRYRFNPLYRNHFKPGQFVSDPNATLPKAEEYMAGMCASSIPGFDWLAEENNSDITYSDLELDRMIAELNEKGYGDMMYGAVNSGADEISYEMPQRRVAIRVWRSHSR